MVWEAEVDVSFKRYSCRTSLHGSSPRKMGPHQRHIDPQKEIKQVTQEFQNSTDGLEFVSIRLLWTSETSSHEARVSEF